MKRKWLLGAAIGVGLLAPLGLLAQSLITESLTGTETILAQTGGLGGGSIATTVEALRNATGYVLVATGGTVNTTVPNTVSNVINTGAITTWNITLPTAPFDGQVVGISCAGGAASPVVAVTLPASVTIVGTSFTTCASGGVISNGAQYQYSTSANKWYRTQ